MSRKVRWEPARCRRPGDQPGQCVLAGVGLEIEGDGFLVAVAGEEVGGLRIVFGPDEGRAPGTRIVSPARVLDLDHTGAEVAEHHSRMGSGQRAGEIDDGVAGQRSRRCLVRHS